MNAEPAAAAPGLLLHCSGPLQSWGHHSHFNQRDTAAFPTRSGIIGLLAAALGHSRTEPIDGLAHLRITVRVDRPGVVLRDLHTVGGGLPPSGTVTTAQGKKRSGDTTTLLSHRHYLADAAFTVALTPSPDTPAHVGLLQECAEALRAPRWPLYLGRRACPPTGPLLLSFFDDALHHLVRLPVAATAPRPGGPTRVVEFLADQPLDRLPLPADTAASDPAEAAHPTARINDQPTTFHPRLRTYQARPLYRRTFTPPSGQWGGLGTDYLTSLAAYLEQALPTGEGSRR
ncbi:type I-E CRISPR-associated protein Cas5/CasD [Streptomyces nodosus]|uniref:CRISPR-associated protein n=1 Tax=Streptomyces nodosus TaxID=40318 RepID=A0A0B5D9X3_9ACTN|nr:type I-E CRISPR-associated protein Cas5/CasD [Streptomyces nodosus]AJE40084.1 CRISPR-associated protein [Streptomyces nodosus]MBB4791085.1 CRISPR system Cascade subunit CasD [Streptomyces nodosus]QEV38663.1 type I-E CRISPR-associated protein Cas5/CasD [Streptomyces nodosus]